MDTLIASRLNPYEPTRRAALDSLKRFVPHAGQSYRSRRNFDLGPENRENTSTLSPYLRNRLISEWEIARAVRARHSYRDAEKFLQEVFWRSYWKGYLDNRPVLWNNYLADRAALLQQHISSPDYLLATAGQTGIDCFDFWIQELTETGYLHNHARMWFASIWIFTLRLPWQLGADFFLQHLLDGDPASNTLSWRWVAGLHTRGKTYLATADNIQRYTEGRFGQLDKLASSTFSINDPHPLPEPHFRPLPPAPQTLPDSQALILLDEDLGGDASYLPHSRHLIGLYLDNGYDTLNISNKVKDLRKASLENQLDRFRKERDADTTFGEAAQADYLIEWARRRHVDTFVLAQPQVGPWQDHWRNLKPALHQAGLALVEFRPPWEEQLFPHATAGFYKLKKQLPKLLANL